MFESAGPTKALEPRYIMVRAMVIIFLWRESREQQEVREPLKRWKGRLCAGAEKKAELLVVGGEVDEGYSGRV